RPCKHALDEVMAQQRDRRKPPLERFAERVDLVDAFARETALAEQILIDVRDPPCVDVETDVPGVETGEPGPRRRLRADADSRLQNPGSLADGLGVRARQ